MIRDEGFERLRKFAEFQWPETMDPAGYIIGSWDEWPGNLYRVGPVPSERHESVGTYFHVDPAGAAFYGDNVQEHPMPESGRTAIVDFRDEAQFDEIRRVVGEVADQDIGLALEQYMPEFRRRGYKGVLIAVETGAGVEGQTLEYVRL